MSLKRRLLLALIPIALALIAIGLLAVVSVDALGRAGREILSRNYRSVLAAQRMKEALERIDSATLFVVAGEREKGEAQLKLQQPLFEEELRIQQGNLTETGEADATAALHEAWTIYVGQLEALPQAADPKAHYLAQLEPAFFAVKEGANVILTMNQDAMVLKSEQLRLDSRRVGTVTILAVLLSLLVGFGFSVTLTERALRPLAVLGQAVRRLGEGDLAARASVTGPVDLQQLGRDFDAMAGRLQAYRESSLGELLQAQQSSQAAIDSLPDPVLVFARDGSLQGTNRAGESLSLTDEALRPLLDQVRAHVLSGKGPYVPRGYEEAVQVGARFLLPRGSPVTNESGAVVAATVLLQDVTRLRRFDELKNDLVATVAHEFRTPLTSLRMAIHLTVELAAGPLTEKQLELLVAAREDCERLQGIVDDLLDLSRLQSGRLDLERAAVKVSALVEEVVDAHRTFAAQQDVKLETALGPFVAEQVVDADASRLGLVLANLVSNAIRYTPAGGTVTVGFDGARFEVRDTGPGIGAEHQKRIFEKFFRVPGSASKGAGLGLAIAREIVEAHGGQIGVDSTPGQGSRFWFTIG